MNYTKGPWHVHVNAADDCEINDKDGRTVVKWYESEDCLSPSDPGIVAAAPEMYELLEKLSNANPEEAFVLEINRLLERIMNDRF